MKISKTNKYNKKTGKAPKTYCEVEAPKMEDNQMLVDSGNFPFTSINRVNAVGLYQPSNKQELQLLSRTA